MFCEPCLCDVSHNENDSLIQLALLTGFQYSLIIIEKLLNFSGPPCTLYSLYFQQ